MIYLLFWFFRISFMKEVNTTVHSWYNHDTYYRQEEILTTGHSDTPWCWGPTWSIPPRTGTARCPPWRTATGPPGRWSSWTADPGNHTWEAHLEQKIFALLVLLVYTKKIWKSTTANLPIVTTIRKWIFFYRVNLLLIFDHFAHLFYTFENLFYVGQTKLFFDWCWE